MDDYCLESEMVSRDERGYMTRIKFGSRVLWISYTRKGYGRGGEIHDIRQFNTVVSGLVLFKLMIDDKEQRQVLQDGESIVIPVGVPHVSIILRDAMMIEWHDGELPSFEKKVLYDPYRKLCFGDKHASR